MEVRSSPNGANPLAGHEHKKIHMTNAPSIQSLYHILTCMIYKLRLSYSALCRYNYKACSIGLHDSLLTCAFDLELQLEENVSAC